MQQQLLSLIKSRHSGVAFEQKLVAIEKISIILEAARWAPSARNSQPWQFIVIQDKYFLEQTKTTLHPTNFWAKKAPLFIAVISSPSQDSLFNNKQYYLYDCGLAVMNLCLQAQSEGLTTHQLAAYDEDKLKQILQIPQNLQIVILIAVGYEKKSTSLLDKIHLFIRKKLINSRSRKTLSELVYLNTWGNNWKI